MQQQNNFNEWMKEANQKFEIALVVIVVLTAIGIMTVLITSKC